MTSPTLLFLLEGTDEVLYTSYSANVVPRGYVVLPSGDYFVESTIYNYVTGVITIYVVAIKDLVEDLDEMVENGEVEETEEEIPAITTTEIAADPEPIVEEVITEPEKAPEPEVEKPSKTSKGK